MAVVKERLYVPERIKKLRDLLFTSPWEFDVDRMKYYTESYKKTEGQTPAVRAARGLEEMLGRMNIRIDDGETIIGSKSSKRFGATIYIEAGVDPYLPLVLRHYKSGVPFEKAYPQGYFGVSADYLKTLAQITEEEYRTITEGDPALLAGQKLELPPARTFGSVGGAGGCSHGGVCR